MKVDLALQLACCCYYMLRFYSFEHKIKGLISSGLLKEDRSQSLAIEKLNLLSRNLQQPSFKWAPIFQRKHNGIYMYGSVGMFPSGAVFVAHRGR